MNLRFLLGKKVIGVASYYRKDRLYPDVVICMIAIAKDDSLVLEWPLEQPINVGDFITVHLDNRTGVWEYDADLEVKRLSYKGEVASQSGSAVQLKPREFEVYYGPSICYDYQMPGYSHAPDNRPDVPLPETPLQSLPQPEADEDDNKIGVLITQASLQPHTTVLAFLSSDNDDVFFITQPHTFKAKVLLKNNLCQFAIDTRSNFYFEKSVEFNYSVVTGRAHLVPREHELYESLKQQFIAKNPWEIGFFSQDDLDMYHIHPEKVTRS